MTYNELIEKLKESFDSVSNFAHEDIPYDYNNYSEAALKAQKDKDEWLKNNPNPGYGKEGYNIWYNKYKQLPDKYSVAAKEWKEINQLPDWEEVAQYGGEGKGNTWYSVKYFPDLNIYIKVNGYYQSYNGTEFYEGWDSCSQVRPTQKTITVYE